MPPDLLPFRAPPAAPAARPDPAVALLPRLARVRDALRLAGRVRDRSARTAARGWAVPPLFFFHPGPQAEWEAARPARPPDPHRAAARRADPLGAAAWDGLPDLAADVLGVLAGSVPARHAARAVPGLAEAAEKLAPDHPTARAVAAVLGVADDEVILVLDPAAGRGWRVRVRGVADLHQFHVLFAAAAAGDFFSGPRPDARVVAAYRGRPPAGGALPAVEARFQFVRPTGLRADGTLPPGFAGSGHWLWGPEPVAAVPRVDGERVILLGEPAFPAAWDPVPKLPHLPAAVDVVADVAPAAVDDWLRDWCGAVPVRRPMFAGRRAA